MSTGHGPVWRLDLTAEKLGVLGEIGRKYPSRAKQAAENPKCIAKVAKLMPQGLKPALIPGHLRHD
jgi:hypothetical protein